MFDELGKNWNEESWTLGGITRGTIHCKAAKHDRDCFTWLARIVIGNVALLSMALV